MSLPICGGHDDLGLFVGALRVVLGENVRLYMAVRRLKVEQLIHGEVATNESIGGMEGD